jgi:hypothetical protein
MCPFALHMSANDPKRTSEPDVAPSNLAELLGSPQTADHRNADQIVIGSLWIGDNIAQTSAKLVGILQVLLVLDRLLLHVLLSDGAALCVVAIELLLWFATVTDVGEAPGKVEGVVDTAIHAHPAEWICGLRRRR